MRVLLVSMPFAAMERPSLALSLLKARLALDDVLCDVAYLNLAFAQHLGRHDYDCIADGLPYTALAGEWVFARCLYGEDGRFRDTYVDDVLRHTWGMAEEEIGPVLRARSLARSFLNDCLASVPWGEYEVVGFTSVCAQNTASLALARRVKEDHPAVRIVFGGHNWSGVMAHELHQRFPFVDFAFSGEADSAFPALLERLALDSAARTPGDVPGLVYRVRGNSRASPEEPIEDLDALPVPQHVDYFEWLSRCELSGSVEPVVPVETSRGCWWGARRPCTFCGLNGPVRGYRAKSPARIIAELREVSRSCGHAPLDIIDNVVSPRFLTDVLPQLAAQPLLSPVRFKIRADVGREQIALMAAANASVKAGIESLSDNILQLMNKGTTTLDNVRLLKWCKASGVHVDWNMLCGVPGEELEDYLDMVRLLPSIRFTEAPRVFGSVVLERFSPYFEEPSRYGFGSPRPVAAYSYVYPFPDAALQRIAYFFDHDYRPGLGRSLAIARLAREVDAWRTDGDAGTLRSVRTSSGRLVLIDGRSGAPGDEVALDSLESLLYEACDDIRSRDELVVLARAGWGDDVSLAAKVDSRLQSLVARRLMANVGDRYIGLTVSG